MSDVDFNGIQQCVNVTYWVVLFQKFQQVDDDDDDDCNSDVSMDEEILDLEAEFNVLHGVR